MAFVIRIYRALQIMRNVKSVSGFDCHRQINIETDTAYIHRRIYFLHKNGNLLWK